MTPPPQDPFLLNQCTDIPRAAVNRKGLGGINSLGVNGRLVELMNRCPGIHDVDVHETLCPPQDIPAEVVVQEVLRGPYRPACRVC